MHEWPAADMLKLTARVYTNMHYAYKYYFQNSHKGSGTYKQNLHVKHCWC